MPTLPKTYSASRVELPIAGGRRASGEDFYGGSLDGKVVSEIGAHFRQEQENGEARTALIESTRIRAEYARQLDEAERTGADTSKLKEQMQSDLSKVGENFQTQRGIESLALHSANSEFAFDAEANRIGVQRARQEATAGANKYLMDSSAILRKNAGYLPMAEQGVDALVATYTNLPAAERAKIADHLKKELNGTMVTGLIASDPEKTRQRLEAGEFYLDPQQREQAIGHAKTEVNNRRIEANYLRQEQDRKEQETVDKGRDRFYDLIRSGKARWEDIRDAPEFASTSHYAVAAKKELMVMMDAKAKPQGEGDKALVNQRWLEINSRGLFNPSAIVADVASGRLTHGQGDYLLNQMRNLRDGGDQTFRSQFAAAMRLQKDVLQKDLVMGATEEGRRQQEAVFTALREEFESTAEKRRTSTAKGQDPADLLDPNNKDYFFTKKRVEEIKARVVGQEMAAQVEAAVARGAPKVTGLADPQLSKLKVGEIFVDERGNVRKMTEELKKKVKAAPKQPEFPIVPSGETQDRIKAREAAVLGAKYSDWQQGIGR